MLAGIAVPKPNTILHNIQIHFSDSNDESEYILMFRTFMNGMLIQNETK